MVGKWDIQLTCSYFDGHIEAEHEFVPFKKAIADVVIEVAGQHLYDVLQKEKNGIKIYCQMTVILLWHYKFGGNLK